MIKYEYYLAAIPKYPSIPHSYKFPRYLIAPILRRGCNEIWSRVPCVKPPYSRELIAEWIDAILCHDLEMNMVYYRYEERKLMIL